MFKPLFAVAALTLATLAPMAHAASCDVQATEKKLAGAAKNSFVKKCEADGRGTAGNGQCEAQADGKKLAGAARNSFVKKCEKDSGGAPSAEAACDAQAAERKLAGAAKTSFTKKCVADAVH